MTIKEFVAQYPVLYHMAEAGSWDSIRQHGLLSTTGLLDLFEVTGNRRTAIEEKRRPTSVAVEHPQYGRAVIRDQGPLADGKLRQALQDGLTPADWYRLLNGMVFFWTEEERLNRLLGGRQYRGRSHTILTVDSASLLGAHADDTMLSPINSGAMPYGPTPRGRSTFVALAEWPSAVKRNGRLRKPVVEVGVRYGVKHVGGMVINVAERQASAD